MAMWEKYLKSVFLSLFLSLVVIQHARSQATFESYALTKPTYNWVFGNSSSFISFNRVTLKPEIKTGKAGLSVGAAASVSDPRNGNLFFYTNGQNVYDVTHRIMPGGSGLNANPAGNQTVAVCPVPGQFGRYFVFTNSASNISPGVVQATVVNMNLFGNEISTGGVIVSAPPVGDVETNFKNISVIAGVSEGMVVVPHSNGTDFWLITQTPDLTNRPLYNATLISSASYVSKTFSTNQSGFGLPSRASHFSYHPELKLLAVAVSNRQTDAFVIKFDDATGSFQFQDEFLFNSALPTTVNQTIYDIEWSRSGNYLYYTVHGEDGSIPGNLFQFDRRNSTVSIAQVISAPVTRSLGLQRAPDGFIYHLYREGSLTKIGRIEEPENQASQVNYVSDIFPGVDWAANQFPAVPPQAPVDLNILVNFYGNCQNNSTVFFPSVTPAADSLVWEFADGEFFSGWSPVYTFQSNAPANVKVKAFLNGQSKEVALPVNIQPFQLSIQLPSDTTACRSEFPPPRGIATEENRFSVKAKITGGTPTSVIWSNDQTGDILKPDSAGYYYVIVSDGGGCSSYSGVTVKEYGTTDRRANIWYFGDRAGIDFTTGKVLDNSQMTAPEGCAVVGDQNGRLIFYTDGNKVYNREHFVIAENIGGSPNSTQSSLIIQVPDDESLYYIFTTEANEFASGYTLYYSLFDLKQNNGLGAVVQSRVPLFLRSTERLTARSGWLITHEFGNNAFRSYKITAAGIGNPVISTIGSDHSFSEPLTSEGYIKAGPRNNIVVPLKTSTGNFLEVFHFLDSIGTLTDYRKVNLNESEGQVYGVEFLGLKIYASIKGSPSKIVEYYFDDDDEIIFVQKISNNSEIGALQIAPDGLVYIAIKGSASLGIVEPGEDEPDPSSFNFDARLLAPNTTSLLGLPNFINQFGTGLFQPSIDYNGICLGKPTAFQGSPTDPIDQFTWGFGDGAGSIEQNAEHLYTASGLYTVSMNLKNRCGLDTTLIQEVRIYDLPARPALPGAAVLCNGSVTLDVGQSGLLYFWTTGATVQQIIADREGSYGVLVEDPVSGCKNEAITIVVDNRPDFDLGQDVTLCEGKLGRILDAQNPNAQIQWTLNGIDFSTDQRIQPSTQTPGVYTYGLKVIDPITSCINEDQIVFTIKPAPVFNLIPKDITACGATDGELTIRITEPSLNTFSYFLSGNNSDVSAFSQQPGDYLIPSLEAGTYTVRVGDEISGCSSSKSTGISLNNVSFTVTPVSACEPIELDLTVSNVVAPFKIKMTEASGLFSEKIIQPTDLPPFKTPLVGPGVYTVEIETLSNPVCKLTEENIAVTSLNPITANISSESCSLPRKVSVNVTNPSGSLSYSWTGPGLSSPSPNSPSIDVPSNLSSGSYEYKVKVSSVGPGFCSTDFSVPIVIEAASPVISTTDPCSDRVSLTATPIQSELSYLWYRNTTVFPGDLSGFDALGSQLDLTPADNGVTFLLAAKSSLTGCIFKSAPFVAKISGKVTASLKSTPACDDGKPVTIEAETNVSGATFQWFFKDQVIPGGQNNIIIEPQGLYKVIVTKESCTAEATLQMVRGPLPNGNLPVAAVICDDPENVDLETKQVTLDPGSFVSYEWFRNDLTLGLTSQSIVADREGSYKVILKNSFNCVAADRIEVVNDCIPKLVAPNAFRPSSLIPENNNFFVFSLFITDQFRVYIYNRWGEMVFQSNDRNFKWNGGYNNDASKPLPGGTYAWVIHYVSTFRPSEGIQEKRGGVLLLR